MGAISQLHSFSALAIRSIEAACLLVGILFCLVLNNHLLVHSMMALSDGTSRRGFWIDNLLDDDDLGTGENGVVRGLITQKGPEKWCL